MDHTITVSSKVKNNLQSFFDIDSGDVTTIYNGVDCDVFHPRVDGSKVRTQLGVQSHEALILYAKDLERYNGPQVLVSSIPHIVKECPNIKVVIAGEGTMRDQLMKAADRSGILDYVIFTGRLPYHLMKYYIAAADAIVIPSIAISGHEEGTSSLMLEAMALEKPVVASAVGGLKEVITNRSTGILVPDHDPAALAAALLSIIHNPSYRDLIGKQAREFIIREMTWDHVADKTLHIYEKVLASSSS
jgi:glycosyltransferase involved in cell wall biosynthesis